MTICETFKKTAIKTWFRLSDTKEARLPLGEESITDINLLEIRLAKHPEIQVIKFNKKREGNNGADWEWWLIGKSNKCLGLRIQAKIINLETDSYDQLHYEKQTDKLIKSSRKNKLLPFYCLYTMCDLSQYVDKFTCNSYGGMYETYGCSFVNAFVVKKLKKKKHISYLIQDMFPWHCIFCPLDFNTDDLPARALSVIKMEIQQYTLCREINCDTDEYIKNFSLSDFPPDYIMKLIKNPNEKIDAPDDDLDGIMIIDETVKHDI
jgi:hypothetical protein